MQIKILLLAKRFIFNDIIIFHKIFQQSDASPEARLPIIVQWNNTFAVLSSG